MLSASRQGHPALMLSAERHFINVTLLPSPTTLTTLVVLKYLLGLILIATTMKSYIDYDIIAAHPVLGAWRYLPFAHAA